jgi:hypothetical protein
MVEWNTQSIGRLYELYERYVDDLRRDVAAANSSLGSLDPEKTRLECLTRAQFEAILTDPTKDPEAVHLWVRRIIRGHENEFPALQAAG